MAELVHLGPCSDDLFVGIDNVLVNVSGDGFIGGRNGSVDGVGGISSIGGVGSIGGVSVGGIVVVRAAWGTGTGGLIMPFQFSRKTAPPSSDP